MVFQNNESIPLTHHIFSLFYNKNIFWGNDIEIPMTWEDSLKEGEKLKANGIIPSALGAKERWPAQFWFDYLLVRTVGYEYRELLVTEKASLWRLISTEKSLRIPIKN